MDELRPLEVALIGCVGAGQHQHHHAHGQEHRIGQWVRAQALIEPSRRREYRYCENQSRQRVCQNMVMHGLSLSLTARCAPLWVPSSRVWLSGHALLRGSARPLRWPPK